MPRYLLEVSYDGTQFHGSQLQGDLPTVQLAVNQLLKTLFKLEIESYGASRTDEGVHARSNFFHFDVPNVVSFDFLYKANAILPSGVAVLSLQQVSETFNARFDATSRQYRYIIYSHKDPFLLNRGYFFPLKIDESTLHQTAAILKEYSNFESFSKRNTQSKTFLCSILDSRWERVGKELHYIVEANRFLRGMVRGLVATQLQVARGKYTIDGFRKIIEAQNCTKAFFDVPGHGLYLEKVNYPASV